VRKPTLAVSGVLVMLSALSQADAQTTPGSYVTWTTGMQQYVRSELQDTHNVPEPETLSVFAVGLGLLGFATYRRRARGSSRRGQRSSFPKQGRHPGEERRLRINMYKRRTSYQALKERRRSRRLVIE
jgi:hypothetical protein